MKRTVFVAAAAIVAIAIATTLMARPKPCTGNIMQDDLIACGLKLGDQK